MQAFFHDGNPIAFQAPDCGPDMVESSSRHVEKDDEELGIVCTYDSQDKSYLFNKDTRGETEGTEGEANDGDDEEDWLNMGRENE